MVDVRRVTWKSRCVLLGCVGVGVMTIVGKRASVCGYGKDCASTLCGSGARGVMRHASHRPQALKCEAFHRTLKLDTPLMSPTESFTAEFVARVKAVYGFFRGFPRVAECRSDPT